MAEQVQSNPRKQYMTLFHTVMIILFTLFFRYLPSIGPITFEGMTILGIFIGLIYGLSTIGGIWPSLLAIVAIPLTGAAPLGVTLASGLGCDSSFLMLYMMVFAELLSRNQVTKILAFWLMSRPILQGRPWLFSFCLLYGMFFFGSLGATFGLIIIFWSIITTVAREAGLKPYDKWPTLMILGITLSALFTSSMWLFRGNPLFLSAAYAKVSGVTLSMFSYSLFNFILATVAIICFTLLCKYLFRVDISGLKNMDLTFIKAQSSKMTFQQKFLLLSFIGIIATIMGVGFMPKTWAITTALTAIGNSGCVALWLIALMIIKIDGQPVLHFKEMSSGIMWDVWFLCGAVLAVAGLMLADGLGIKEALIMVVSPILTGQGSLLFIILVVLIATVLTNFVANTVIGLLFVPIIYSCSMQLGVDGTPSLVLMLVCIHLAILTPGASPMAAMLFGNSEWIKPGDVYKYGGVSVGILLLILLIIGIPLANLLF